MSTFELALPPVLRHEGGYSDNPNDPGGPTKYGISLRWLKSQGLHADVNGDLRVDIADIIALTPETAGGFYRVEWWDRYGYGRILDQRIATKVLDTSVNMGAPAAAKFAQVASGATADGVLGPESIRAINDEQPAVLLHRMQDLQALRYRELAQNPKLSQFLPGWLNRAFDRI